MTTSQADDGVFDAELTISKVELLPDGNDHMFRRFIHDLLAFSSRLQNVRARFGSFIGLSGIQYTILIAIRQYAGVEGVGIKALAGHLRLSNAFVTIETTKLVKRDLLNKKINASDHRRVLLAVTDRGRALLADLAPIQRQINDMLFQSLDSECFAQLTHQVSRLCIDAEKALLLADYLIGKNGAKLK